MADQHPSERTSFQTKRGETPEEDETMGLVTTGIIERVDPYKDGTGWSVTYDSWGTAIKSKWGVEPKIGDRFTCYGTFGSSYHGQSLNGHVLYYDSVEQEEANRAAEHAEYEAKRLREYADNLPKMNANYEALPPAFKARIKRNRASDPEYRWQAMGESYEVFTCQQAVTPLRLGTRIHSYARRGVRQDRRMGQDQLKGK